MSYNGLNTPVHVFLLGIYSWHAVQYVIYSVTGPISPLHYEAEVSALDTACTAHGIAT